MIRTDTKEHLSNKKSPLSPLVKTSAVPSPGIALACIIILAILINILQIADGHHWGDFALYVMQAESIVTNQMDQLYQINKFSIDKTSSPNGPYLYPWGFPILLAPFYALFGLDIYVFKLLIIFFFGASLLAIFIVFRRRLGDKFTLLLVGIFAFNPLFIYHNNSILSDIPYLFFSLITVFLIQRVVIDERKIYNNTTSYLLIGFLIFMSYLIRSNGIIFLPVLLLCQLIKKYMHTGKIRAVFNLSSWNVLSLLPYFLFVMFKIIVSKIFPEGSSSHYDLLSMVSFSSLTDNSYYYLKLTQHFYFLSSLEVLYYITAPFLLYGIYKNLKEDYLYLLYVGFSLIILIIWPFIQGFRFVFPLLPFYFYFTFIGFREFEHNYLRSYFKFKVQLVAIFGIFLIAVFLIIHSQNLIRDEKLVLTGPFTEESQDMIRYINDHFEVEDTIVFRKPRSILLLTDKFSFREERLEKVKRLESHYFVYDNLEKGYQVEMEKITPVDSGYFNKIYQNERYTIYKIQKNGVVNNTIAK